MIHVINVIRNFFLILFKFKHLLFLFRNSYSDVFYNLDYKVWEGHFLFKMYASEDLSEKMWMNGTAFQNANSKSLHQKNSYGIKSESKFFYRSNFKIFFCYFREVLRAIYYFLKRWVIENLGDSSQKKAKQTITLGKVKVEKIRELYFEALQIIADTHDPKDQLKYTNFLL